MTIGVPASTHRRAMAGLTVLAAATCLGGIGCGTGPTGADRASEGVAPVTRQSPYLNTRPGVAYVGDAACARCHEELAASYRKHPMGRSATTPAEVLPDAIGAVFEVGELVYSVERRDGRVFHRETIGDGAADASATIEAEVRLVLGSGTRGYSFVVERDEGLFQSPIAWYTQERKWDLPPSYREHNLHFDRSISMGCLFCHVNRVETVKGRPTAFHGLAIGCERCHGPGSLHSGQSEPAGGGGRRGGEDRTIVNPARLEPSLREAVCEQCHFQGTERHERPGHSWFDYRPGLPFDAFFLVFTSRHDPAQRSRAVGQVEEMRSSRCFRESGGRLGCVSCHDPHKLPEPDERVAFYRDRCLACHADRGCGLPKAERLTRSRDDDCASCHMPRYRTSNVAHTTLTNHTVPINRAPAAR